MYKNGTNKETLLSVLHSMDELTGMDRLVRSGQRFHIDAEMRGGTLFWTMDADHSGYTSEGINRKKGKGYSALVEALDKLNVSGEINEGIVVLALAGVSESKNFDGTVKTVWYVIDPCSVGMDDAKRKMDFKRSVAMVEYPILQIPMTEAEYKCCTSRLALYDEFEEVVYPIMECAYSSIGNLMDCESAFKYKSNVPIASATFLAERIAGSTGIRFLYRSRTDKVKPMISVVGTRYVLYSQHEFVKAACEIAQEHCVCHVSNWTVSDELTKVSIVVDDANALYRPVIELRTSDTLGNSMSVSAYIRMGKGKILLRKNSAYHWITFEKRGGVRSLFDGIFEAIEDFENNFEGNAEQIISFDATSLNSFKRVLGKKRFDTIKLPENGEYAFADLVYQVVDGLYCELNVRWADELSKEYANFYNKLCGSNVIVIKASKEEQGEATSGRKKAHEEAV